MVNLRAKGNRIRLRCKKELEAGGYKVAIVENTSKFAKERDLWGLFDLEAICPEGLLYVQVTCGKPHPHLPYTLFAKEFPWAKVQQWVWNRRFKIYEYFTHNKYVSSKLK